MAPPGALLEEYRDHDYDHDSISTSLRATKRQKLEVTQDDSAIDADEATAIRRHPLGIRPSGNAVTSTVNLKPACGNFATLPDELIIQLLEHLDAKTLLRLGGTCRALFAFARAEELWKPLFVESAPSSFSWRGTWRSTYLNQDQSQEPKVDCSNLFSDALHRPYFCAHVPLEPFVSNIPARNQIIRLPDATVEQMLSMSNTPFILANPTKRWPIYGQWTTESLLEKYSDVKFRAEAVDWRFDTYVSYMRNNNDESPLYLFDHSFAQKMGIEVAEPQEAEAYEKHHSNLSLSALVSTDNLRDVAYWPPTCFGPSQDLFSVLGPQRPHHRWLIVGPARSGSTFHKDPNGTCAWNAVLKGRKYWIMFPSSASLPPPPGVFVSEDQSEVTSPLSIAEWLLGFHAEARATEGCVEGICEEGEVVYVPAGWYHLVVNLDESIALTQNFVPRQNLKDVLAFLRDRKEQISGFADEVLDPYGLFVERLRERDPEVLEEALARLERMDKGRKGRWEELIKGGEEEEGEGVGFSFGFGGDDDDEEVP